MSKIYYWLKLKNDFFKNKRMKKLRKIAGGDTYTIIYLKMMLLSLESAGVLFFEGVEEDFADELALALDEDPENVKVTITFLQKVGLIEQHNGNEFFLTEVPTITGKETDKAQLMRDRRERKKIEASQNGNNVTAQLPDVTFCYTEKEKELDKELEKELEEEKELELDNGMSKDKLLTIPYQQIIDLFNEKCPSLPKVMKLTDKRKRLIKKIYKDYGIDDFIRVFETAEQSPFLRGEQNTADHASWIATFDFLMIEEKFVKCLEGGYQSSGRYKPKAAQDLENSYEMIARWAEGGDSDG